MKKSNLFVLGVFLVGVFILAACGGGAKPGLSGTSWKLVSYGQAAATAQVETDLSFDADGKLSGTMGCNSFGGSYEDLGGQVKFGPLMSTLMACSDELMQQESAVFQVLNGSLTYVISADTLTIQPAAGDIVLVFARK